ncbi:MAG: hypothetical protein FWG51_04715, partial [Firmicutes bacterium]|nr:hypothetical protein [Bacillota bacterium]
KKSAQNTLIKFENFNSDDKVKLLTGKPAFIPLELLPLQVDKLLPTEAFIGYTIVDELSGVIGKIINMDNSTPNILLLVDYSGIEMFVPFSLISSILMSSNKSSCHLV